MTDSFRVRREVFLALVSAMACGAPRPVDPPPPTPVVLATPSASASPPPPLVPPPTPSATAALGPDLEIVDDDSERDELAHLPGPACEEALFLPMPSHDEPSALYVRIGALTVSGRTPPDSIRSTIRTRARGLLGHCASLITPDMGEPRVPVAIMFDQDGKTMDPVGYPAYEPRPEPLYMCAYQALRSLTYLPPEPSSTPTAKNRVTFIAPLSFKRTRPRYDLKEMQAWASRINVPCKNRRRPPP